MCKREPPEEEEPDDDHPTHFRLTPFYGMPRGYFCILDVIVDNPCILFYNYYYMSSIFETNYQYLLEKKPYVTKTELSLLLGKQGKNLDKKVSQLLRKKELISLKKGLYINPLYLQLQKGRVEEYLANILYYPSYLSLEYVLQKEGLIPEAVYAYTSVTSKATRIFTNNVGTFLYRHLKPSLFTGYYYIRFIENYRIKIASKAKALFDFLYLRPLGRSQSSISRALFEDLRINWDIVGEDDVLEFREYVISSKSQKMMLVGKVMERRIL